MNHQYIRLHQAIEIHGFVTIRLRDFASGQLLQERHGDNLIVDLGLEALVHLLAGDIPLITGAPGQGSRTGNNLSAPCRPDIPGVNLNAMLAPLPYCARYAQFGISANAPLATDGQAYPDPATGTLGTDPSQVSEIVGVSYFFPPPSGVDPTSPLPRTSVTFQAVLGPQQGNGPGGSQEYSTVVLLGAKVVDPNGTPLQYRMLAHKVYGAVLKTPQTILEADWTISFRAQDV